MGENRQAGHFCVGKPLILALRIGMKTLKVLIEKVRTNAGFYLHLHLSISSTTLEMT
jgi:hypothetical protein